MTALNVLERLLTLDEAITTGQLNEREANTLRFHLQDSGLGYGPHSLEKWIEIFDVLATEEESAA